MNQIGDLKYFSFLILPTGTNIYSYVWKWWDGSSEATTVPAAHKVVNIGGDPDNHELHYSCTAVAVDGQEVTLNGTFDANNPPSVVPSPSISVNDAYLPYSTKLSLSVYDIEDDPGPCAFSWYSGTSFLSAGTAGASTSVTGTWQGNGVTDIRSYTAFENHYYALVFSDRQIDCFVLDTAGGTTQLSFDLRGFPRPSPPSGVLVSSPNIFTDILLLLPVQRIHSGAYFDFEVIAKDVNHGPLTFHWSFNGSHNWTVPVEGPGVSTTEPDGSVRNTYHKDISAEVVTAGTQKTVVGTCIILSQTARTDVSEEVILLRNSAPSSVVFAIKDATTGQVFADLTAVPLASVLQYEAAVTDPDNDTATVEWFLTLSTPGVAAPASYHAFGPKIMVTPQSVFDSAALADPGCRIAGSVVIYDRLGGGPLSRSLPVVTLV